jgi:hypothetical protein
MDLLNCRMNDQGIGKVISSQWDDPLELTGLMTIDDEHTGLTNSEIAP